MRKRLGTVFLVLLVLISGWTIIPNEAKAAFNGIIKVRISPSGQSSDIRVIPHGNYFISEAPGVKLSDTEYKVHLSGSSVQLLSGSAVLYTGPKITIVRAAGNTEANFIVFPSSPTQKTRTNYHGNVEFSVNSGLCAVNHVYVEDYVMGVIPYEMSPSWPAEALKAQAVCARNYGVKAALSSPNGTWHLGDTASSQVYRGVPGVSSTGVLNQSTYNTIKNVVNSTARKVMLYGGSVFSAYFSAWNGGETLNARGWTGNTSSIYGYTTVKADPYDDRRCQSSYWVSRTINTSLYSPTGSDLNMAVQNMVVSKYRSQYGITAPDVYIVGTTGIKGLDPDGVPEVSIVYEKFYCDVRFNTETGTKRVTFTDTDLKSALGISSSYIAFRIQNNSNGTTTLYNVRYGHGVGMSQRGAQQMANEGKSYTDILSFYYNGITYSTLSVSPPTLPAMPIQTPAPTAPPATRATAASATCTSIKVSWKAVSGAKGYRVYRAESAAGPYILVADGVASTSYINTGLKTGSTYYFKVKAYTLAGSQKIYGSLSDVVSAKTVINTPTGLKAAPASPRKIKITWTAVPGVSGYRIYRADSAAGPYTLITSGTTTSSTDTGLTTGKTYYYKVKAYILSGTARTYSDLSDAVSAIPAPSVPSGLKAAPASYNSIKLTWTAVSGASGYEVYRSASASKAYSLIASGVKTNSYASAGLTAGTPYYYTVRAYTLVGTKKVYSGQSTTVSAKPVPAAPRSVAAKRMSPTGIRISWAAVPGASGYEVYRKISSGGPYGLLKTTSSAAYTNTGLKKGKYYYYTVRAYRLVGKTKVYSAFSSTVYAKT